MNVAEIRSLTVRYGKFTALDDFSAELPSGAVGLLGPNGAGKTTFLKTLLGFVKPHSGGGTVNGFDVETQGALIRQSVGYMPEQDCHIPGLSAVRFVAYAGELAGLPSNQALRRAHEVLEYSGLGEARYRPVEDYSTGMKQRIKLAQALVHGPKLLLLDEPTNGLDPRGREEMLDLVQQISKQRGVNILLCSHLLRDVERTCEHVLVLMGGKLRTAGQIRDLTQVAGQPIEVELREPNDAFYRLACDAGLTMLRGEGYRYRFQAERTPGEINAMLFAAARESGAQIRELRIAQRSLEDVFMEAVDG